MQYRKAGSALIVGAAAGAAVAWFRRRHSAHRVSGATAPLLEETPADPMKSDLVERDSAVLPIGRSADPEIDERLSHGRGPEHVTSGAAFEPELEGPDTIRQRERELRLDDVWDSLSGFPEGEQTEGYDAVSPEDLGSVWLERATQTTHEHLPRASDPHDLPALDDLSVRDTGEKDADDDDDIEIAETDLDIPDQDVIDDDLDNLRRSER